MTNMKRFICNAVFTIIAFLMVVICPVEIESSRDIIMWFLCKVLWLPIYTVIALPIRCKEIKEVL